MKSDPEEFLFDDCPICQAQKRAIAKKKNLSYEELQTAFKKAEKQQRAHRQDDISKTKDNANPTAVKKALYKIIQKYGLTKQLSVAAIEKRIYESEGATAMEASNKFQLWWTKFFRKQFEENSPDFDFILPAFTDAWNYFPHKSLGGRSPREKFKEYYGQEPDASMADPENRRNEEMPRVHVGNREMSWGEYEHMLKEMEKEQEPFKHLVDDILQSYKTHLQQEERLSKKTVDRHYGVADIFFSRALHVGFINFHGIRKAFVLKEFPRWWQTHVMFFSLREPEIVSSLKKLFSFIEQTYGLGHEAFAPSRTRRPTR